MQASPDDAIVERARAGDEEAFRTLVEALGRDVFRLAFRMTRNEEDAEDVVQETFIRAYRQLHRFEGRASFGTWIYRIAANTAIDLMRRRARVEARSAPLDELKAGSESDQERLVFARQVRERVAGALGGLSDLERSAFVLRHFEEMPLSEISASLDITVSATKQAIFRAVRKVRSSLEAFPGAVP